MIGAPKAGTTSLFAYLGQHPDIYTSPIKEPCYFADEVRRENLQEDLRANFEREQLQLKAYLSTSMEEKRDGALVVDWDDYLKLFAQAQDERAIGEGSVVYLWSATAAANIAAKVPDARILMILRDPAERAFSQYLQYRTSGVVRHTFRHQIQLSMRTRSAKIGPHNPFLEFGCYYSQLQRYLRRFSRERIHIAFYEDFRRDPAGCVKKILRFLDVNPDFTINLEKRHNQPRVPRFGSLGYFLKRAGIWQRGRRLLPSSVARVLRPLALAPRHALQMEPPDRQYLIAHYREEIRSLSELLGRNLDTWLR